MINILGINAYHGDASASLVIDGKLVAAVEEERFNRIKHWAGFPAESIRWCLDDAGVDAGQYSYTITDLTLPEEDPRCLVIVDAYWPAQAEAIAARQLRFWMEGDGESWNLKSWALKRTPTGG